MTKDYIDSINKEYGVKLTGLSPMHGNKVIPSTATRIIVKDFGNGLGRVLYVDSQNRLVANITEKIK